MSGRDRSKWYPQIVKKQHGEFCNGCGKGIWHNPISKLSSWICEILYIDHIDNIDSHNELENFQLLCPSCNRIKNPKRIEPIPERPFTPEMAKNTKYEAPWRRWINSTILEEGSILFVDAVDGGAEKFGLSPETTRKWIRKLISSQGNYGMFHDSVVFKKDIPILEEDAKKKDQENDIAIRNLNKYSKQED